MNVYVVVEGPTEKIVYPSWINFANPRLTSVDSPDSVVKNNYFLISAMGYPQIFSMIDSAIDDVNNFPLYDRLVISIDSDDMTRDEKYDEIYQFVNGKRCSARIIIVVQHFCIETWALANRRVVRKEPRTEILKSYKRIFNVRSDDPALLPSYPEKDLNRAQFAGKYLRAALNDRHRNLSYFKGKPSIISHNKYYEQIKIRRESTNHIVSFSDFIAAFV